MMLRIPVYLPTLVAIVLTVDFFVSEANGGGLVCTSPCQQPDTSGTSGLALPPCIIDTTRRCGTVGNLPENQAPGVPVQGGMKSSSGIATDGKTYLDVAPYWKASPDRINLLTGYEVRVLCHQSVCATQSLCVTIFFNRTLTVNDTHSNFSVTCQHGDFAQPGMEYVTIIGSLPKSNYNSNEARFRQFLPSCQQEPEVSTCQSPEDWSPSYRPDVSQIANGSVMVTFWQNYHYPIYDVMLQDVDNFSNYHYKIINLVNQGPKVIFDNVQEGTYSASIMINDEFCNDCPMIESESRITVTAVPIAAPSTTPPATSTTPPAPTTTPPAPSTAPLVSSTPSPRPPTLAGTSLILAALCGALGGILLVILLVILIVISVARTCSRSPGFPSMSSGEESKMGGDPTKSTMPHHNNIPYGDCDSLDGNGYIKQLPLSNGTIYMDNSCKFTSPSIVPPNTHRDNMTNIRLLEESQFYADSMAFQQGDSISKVAVDIHSGKDHQTSSKCDQPESPDSGLESIYSVGTLDDERTLFSLALTSLGDEV